MNYAQIQQAQSLIQQLGQVNQALALVAQDNLKANPVTPQVTIAVSAPDGPSACVTMSITDQAILTNAFTTLAQVLQDQAQSLQTQLTALEVTPT